MKVLLRCPFIFVKVILVYDNMADGGSVFYFFIHDCVSINVKQMKLKPRIQ